MSLTEENARLRRSLMAAKTRVQRLSTLLNPQHDFPREWGLSSAEARILAVLVAAGRLTPAGVAELSGDLTRPVAPEVTAVRIYDIRHRTGVTIHVAYGRGYYLAEEDRERLRRYVITDLEKCEAPSPLRSGSAAGWVVPPERTEDWRLFRRKGYSAEEAAQALGLQRRDGA